MPILIKSYFSYSPHKNAPLSLPFSPFGSQKNSFFNSAIVSSGFFTLCPIVLESV